MFSSEYLHEYDLPAAEVTVEIMSVEATEAQLAGGKKKKAPLVAFKGAEKKLLLNKTNAKAIAALYGNDTAAWPGKKVTLFRSTTEMAGETVACIRIRKSQ